MRGSEQLKADAVRPADLVLVEVWIVVIGRQEIAQRAQKRAVEQLLRRQLGDGRVEVLPAGADGGGEGVDAGVRGSSESWKIGKGLSAPDDFTPWEDDPGVPRSLWEVLMGVAT